MKTNSVIKLLCCCLLPFALCLPAWAQGSAFTYQGRLDLNGAPAHGTYDFQFTVRDAFISGAAVGANPLAATLAVSNGLFTTTLDPGPGVFTGAERWLEIAVRTNGNGAFTTLVPRQKLTPAPYAIFSGTAASAASASSLSGTLPATQLTGTVPLARLPSAVVTNNASGVALNGTFTGNGAGLTSLNASNLTNGTVPAAALGNAWQTAGNTGANPASGIFLGTADNLPLELKVNGVRALRLEPNVTSPNVIGGYGGNIVSNGTVAATIGGGGASGFENRVGAGANYATVSGGAGNTANNGAASVGGGQSNLAGGRHAAVSGGGWNTASGISSFIGGGGGDTFGGPWPNTASGNWSAILGGWNNTASGYSSVVGGGGNNTASGTYSVVPGGSFNEASGAASLAAGYFAKALHDGAFVWADQSGGTFASTAADQFSVRAAGGVRLQTPSVAITGDHLTVAGAGNEQAYLGGDGLAGDVQVGSQNPAVGTVTLWNGGSGSEMSLIARDVAMNGTPRAPGAGVNTPTYTFLAKKTNSFSGFDHILLIDNPLINENPNVFLFVQHNYNGDFRLEPKAVGVYLYSIPGGARRWGIYHEDLSAMPAGASFNVMIVKP